MKLSAGAETGLTSSALEWWEEWQLRVLVLSSLCVQFLLFFTSCVRRLPALRRLRVVVWLAYIGGDALAIYALATLLTRHKEQTSTSTTDVVGESMSSSNQLEVLWAPVLLIHLGGHETLSAFSLEDNELWVRHILTLVSQVTIALYVFCRWWSGELKLLLAAVMLFVFGILKFSLKPWALRKARYSQMLACTDVSRPRQGEGDGATGYTALSLDAYVSQAKQATMSSAIDARPPMVEGIRHTDYFVDLSAPYGGRLSDLRYLQNKNKKQMDASYKMLQSYFSETFELLYTRIGKKTPVMDLLFLLLLPFLTLASLVLFGTSHKHGYSSRDIKVTYILFSCTAMVEFLFPLWNLIPVCIPCLTFLTEALKVWHQMVFRYDLMSFYVRKKKPTFLMKIVFFKCLREYVSKVWYVRQVPAAREITELVQRYIEEDGWKTHIVDAATYRSFSNFRGQLTLKRFSDLAVRQRCDFGHELWYSLKVPFDKSVLLWHIATNLCFHRPVDRPSSFPQGQSHLTTKHSMEMSEYMLYLLFIRTEMLLPGTRPGLFTVAIDELEEILKDSDAKLLMNKKALAQEIIKYTVGDTLIHQACRLAVSLMKLQEEQMWKIIQGVWVEMLCYSAIRCRGYLHAKSLGEGGEYLSYVWLLWSYMGMQTLPDKIQKPESPAEEEEILSITSQSASSFQGRLCRQSSNGSIFSPV